MDNQQVMEAEIGWLAGFFDGEGYIGLRVELHTKQGIVYIRPEMNLGNCDEAMIQKAADIAKRLGVNLHISFSRLKNRKRKKFWKLQTRSQAKLVKLFSVLIPHLTGEKQERTAIVIEFCERRMRQPQIDKHKKLNIPGLAGNGGLKPYTRRQLELFEKVQPMMRRGPRTSETIRRMRSRITQLVNELKAYRDIVETDIEMTLEEYLEL